MLVRRDGSALIVEESGVGLAEEGFVPVPEEAAFELDGSAGGGGTEGGELDDGGADAGGADGVGKVRAALKEAVGRAGGGGSGGGEAVVGGQGGGVGERRQKRVYVGLVGRAGDGLRLRAADVDEGGVVVGRSHSHRATKGEEKKEEKEEFVRVLHMVSISLSSCRIRWGLGEGRQ